MVRLTWGTADTLTPTRESLLYRRGYSHCFEVWVPHKQTNLPDHTLHGTLYFKIVMETVHFQNTSQTSDGKCMLYEDVDGRALGASDASHHRHGKAGLRPRRQRQEWRLEGSPCYGLLPENQTIRSNEHGSSKANSSTQEGSAWSQAAESTCSALRISKTVGFFDDQTKTVSGSAAKF